MTWHARDKLREASYQATLLVVLLHLVLAGLAKKTGKFYFMISCIILLVEVSGISSIFKSAV